MLNQVTFQQTWWSDSQIRAEMTERYLLEDWVYCNENLQRRAIQHTANMIADKYNKLYETTMYTYDPIANVDADETETRTITGTRTNTRTLDTIDTRTPNLATTNDGVKEIITPGTETEKEIKSDKYSPYGR